MKIRKMIWLKIISLLTVINLSLGKVEKSSVIFVIDDTGSMSEDINQVKNGVTSIFDAVSNSKDSLVDNFVLVTFNDQTQLGHKPECLIKSLDRDLFIRKLSQIKVDGGGDCPEMALSGIRLGLKEGLPNSYMYVFTDAVAKDHKTLENLQNLALKRRTQIVFILTACPVSCSYSFNDPMYLVYHKLADATSGQVFHMVKDDVGQILAYIEETMTSKKEPIMKRMFPPGYGHKMEIIVDGAMKDIVIAESGKEPEIELFSSDGVKVEHKSIVDITDAMVVKVIDPKPGAYIAKVGSKSGTSVVVTAESSVVFNYGFYVAVGDVQAPTSCDDDGTTTMPLADIHSLLAVQLVTEDDVTLDSVQFVGIDDTILKEIPLKLLDATKKLYTTTKDFIPPDVLFKISVNGFHVKSNTTLKRSSRTPIEVQKVIDPVKDMPLSMNIDKGFHIKLKVNDPLKLECKVKGYPKPDIVWIDDTGKVLATNVVTINIPYDHRAFLNIEKISKNSTFKCEANNKNGKVNQIISVETDSSYFHVLEKPKDTTIKFIKSGEIHCKVDASPVAEITWKVNGDVIKTNDNFEIQENLLIVKKMMPELVGKYACLAKNDFESVLMQFEIQILKIAPKPMIDGPPKVKAEYDQPLSLNCRATVFPEPKIAWYDDSTGEELLSFPKSAPKSYYVYERELKIDRVYNNAVYRCTTSNSIGEASTTVTVETSSYFKIDKSPKNTKIQYKKDGQVFCKADAKPSAKIQWLYKNKPINKKGHYQISADNTTLTIKDMQPNLAGYYSCLVSYKNNFTDLVFKIAITGLVRPVIDKTVKTLNVLEGSTVNIDCKILQGTPAPKITWMFRADYEARFEDLVGITNSTIQIVNVSRNQAGSYRCIARNPKTKDSHTVYLTVEYPPKIEKAKKRITAEDGKVMTLKCLTHGEPTPTVSWYLNDMNIAASKQYKIYGDNSLSFIATPAKGGVFNCTASNKHGSTSILTEVNYFVPVTFDRPLDTSIDTNVGKEEPLSCVADGYPTPTIQWLFFSSYVKIEKLPKVIRNAVSPDTLMLKVSSLDQDGDYTCIAKNGPSEKNMTYTVHVYGKPKIVDPASFTAIVTIQAVVGDMLVRVPCKAIGRPKPVITWINGKGFNIAAGTVWNDVDDDGSLIIKNIDEGGYVTCVAENSFGADRKSFYVVVNNYPHPSHPVSEHSLKVDEPAEISCPLPHTKVDFIRWYMGETLITTFEDQLLRFDSVAMIDGGIYTCRVSSLTAPAQSASVKIIPVE